jgi:hypothetical protein
MRKKNVALIESEKQYGIAVQATYGFQDFSADEIVTIILTFTLCINYKNKQNMAYSARNRTISRVAPSLKGSASRAVNACMKSYDMHVKQFDWVQ